MPCQLLEAWQIWTLTSKHQYARDRVNPCGGLSVPYPSHACACVLDTFSSSDSNGVSVSYSDRNTNKQKVDCQLADGEGTEAGEACSC